MCSYSCTCGFIRACFARELIKRVLSFQASFRLVEQLEARENNVAVKLKTSYLLLLIALVHALFIAGRCALANTKVLTKQESISYILG